MKLLLDTHSFLWFIAGDPHLSEKARTLIEIWPIPVEWCVNWLPSVDLPIPPLLKDGSTSLLECCVNWLPPADTASTCLYRPPHHRR
ncbi:MAG: hypothetical protein WCS37_16545, partial [Chloroflexota bacterium]